MDAGKKIDRASKNLMRSQVEDVLKIQREIDKKIDIYREETGINEYINFWDDLKLKNNDTIKTISRFMVLKCNR